MTVKEKVSDDMEAEFDGYGINLVTTNPNMGNNIYIRPAVLKRIVDFYKKITGSYFLDDLEEK